MARLKILAAVATFEVLFFVAVAAGSNYPTTMTTVVDMDEEENPSESERCSQQIQSQRQLNACHEYLRESSRCCTTKITLTTQEEEEENQSGGWREHFQRCCQQLEHIEEQCRCEGVKRIVQRQRQEGELQGQEMQEMLKTAESLPALCRMTPHHCDVQSSATPF